MTDLGAASVGATGETETAFKLSAVEDLKKRRSKERLAFTGLLKDLRKLYSEGDSGNQDVLAWRIKTVEDQLALLQGTESALVNAGEGPDANAEKYTSEGEQAVYMAKRLLARLEASSRVSSGGDPGQGATLPPQSPSTISAPPLPLAQFDGDPLEFRPWYGLFLSTFHRMRIDDVSKLAYLRSSLSGDALSAISGIPATAANYQRCLDEIRRRFGDPSLLISLYASKLIKLPRATLDDVRGFRQIIDQFQNYFAEIRALAEELQPSSAASASFPGAGSGEVDSSADPLSLILGPLLESKLPSDVQLSWSRQVAAPSQRFRVLELLEFAKREVENRERLAMRVEDSVRNRPHSGHSSSHSGHSSTHFGHSSSSRRSPFRIPGKSNAAISLVVADACVLCNSSHPLFRCALFKQKTPKERYYLVKDSKLCINCLGSHGGPARSCRSKQSCLHCGGRHHSLLHFPTGGEAQRPMVSSLSAEACDYRPVSSPTPHSAQHSPSLSVVPAAVTSAAPVSRPVFVKIAKVFVRSPGAPQGFHTYAYLDDGSKRSYIREDLAEALGIRPDSHGRFSTGSFGEHVNILNSSLISVQVQDVHGKFFPVVIKVWTVKKLCPPITQEDITTFPPMLQNLSPWVDDYNGGRRDIGILIGADQIWDCCPGTVVRIPGLPVAISSCFGWVLSGPDSSGMCSPAGDGDAPSPAHVIDDLDIQQLWDLEAIGIRDETPEPPSWESPVYIGGRYQVPLPFLDDRRPACNFSAAKSQLRALKAKLSSDQLLLYDSGIRSLLEKNVAEFASSSSGIGYYLPHHGTWRKKLRIVFNASSPAPDGRSLNSFLDPGPNLLPLLVDILLRFRLRAFPVYGDIEAAFHTVGIKPEDRPFLKFLWLRGDTLQTFQFTRVPFGVTCGPFLLHSTIRHHVQNYPVFGEDFQNRLLSGMYCDDLISSLDTLDEAKTFSEQAVICFRDAGMNLKLSEAPSKVLGVPVDPETDQIFVDTSVVTLPTKFTRREFLRLLSRIYDPLGLIAAWTIRARLLLRDMWKSGVGWDDELDEALRLRWMQWSQEAGIPFSVPRCLYVQSASVLHVFCDASANGYAFVAYLVNRGDGPSSASSHFVFAKARVAPLKPSLSVPRKELLAALIGCRFAFHFRTTIHSVRCFLWTDSQTVLTWIKKGMSKRDVFVSNRLKEILEKSDPDMWHYVPTSANPADLPSRGCSLADLRTNQLYRYGPSFLTESGTSWPELPRPSISFAVIEPPVWTPCLRKVISVDSFSSFTRLLRVYGWIRRFCSKLRRQISLRHSPTGADVFPPIHRPLSITELDAALQMLIKADQQEFYSEDIGDLRRSKRLVSTSPLYPLRPRLSATGILEAVPRTGAPPLPILSHRSHLTRLLVDHVHRKLLHQGPEATLAELRRYYWIPRGRSLVKKFVFACTSCRRFKAPPFVSPESQLLAFRVTPEIPFHRVGVDAFGPFYLQTRKVWALIFTCSVTRAVHLELINDNSASSCHLAFRRFLARRVRPFAAIQVYSDNAKCFLRLSSMKFPSHEVDWRTIPERSPWWGGWWERLIRTIKTALRISLRNLSLPERELETVLHEIEAVINCRPLTFTSSQLDDVSPLSPADFLFGTAADFADFVDPAIVSAPSLRRLASLRRDVVHRFWHRWYHEYLSSLQLWRRRQGSSQQPQTNQVVLVKEKSPRSSWALARILELIPGHDGKPRAAWILVRGLRTRRALDLLVPLEADSAPSTLPNRGGASSNTAGAAPKDLHPSTEASSSSPRSVERERGRRHETTSSAAVHNSHVADGARVTRRGRHVVLPRRYRD